jgi:hypothetical protein
LGGFVVRHPGSCPKEGFIQEKVCKAGFVSGEVSIRSGRSLYRILESVSRTCTKMIRVCEMSFVSIP